MRETLKEYNYVGSMISEEAEIIKANWQTMLDRDIAKLDGMERRDAKDIKNYRKKMGWLKRAGKKAHEKKESQQKPNLVMTYWLKRRWT